MVRAEGVEPSRGFPQRIFLPATACAASSCAFALERVCGLDYTFTVARSRFRCCPSSLYTFAPAVRPERLARDCHREEVSPNLSSSASSVSRRALNRLSPLRLPFRHARTSRNLIAAAAAAKGKRAAGFPLPRGNERNDATVRQHFPRCPRATPRQLLLRRDGGAGSGRTPAQGSDGPCFSLIFGSAAR